MELDRPGKPTTDPHRPKTDFEKAVEEETGLTVEEMRSMTVSEKRRRLEQKFKVPMQFVSHWPFVGRKQHSQLMSREEVVKASDER